MSEQAVEQATTEQVAGAQEQTQAAAPDLTVNDLQAIKTIIDVASQRGTFKANELASVGQVYNRLDAFLNHIAPQVKEGAQAEAQKQ